jgi:hypothetical protein
MIVMTRSSTMPTIGYAKTIKAKAVINIPNPTEGISYDSSSFFFKPPTILMIPLASKPKPRKMISHFVANSGKKKPDPI